MSTYSSNSPSSSEDGSRTTYLIRWRGLQYGPFTAATIDEKLATNQLSFHHEISYNGRWMTLREFGAEREALRRAERLAQENQERRAQEEARQAREQERWKQEEAERQEQQHAESMAVARRGHDQMEVMNPYQQANPVFRQSHSRMLKSHRGGTILTLGILGLVLCAPLSFFAWVMGNNDIREMDAGFMDDSGRSMTNAGRIMGMVYSILIIIAVVLIALGVMAEIASTSR